VEDTLLPYLPSTKLPDLAIQMQLEVENQNKYFPFGVKYWQ
jgi:hypothetical protein